MNNKWLKQPSITKKLTAHILLFLSGFLLIGGIASVSFFYTSNYAVSGKKIPVFYDKEKMSEYFMNTSGFQRLFEKYIERTAFYVRYRESGYEIPKIDTSLGIKDTKAIHKLMQENGKMKEFSFYHKKLNEESTCFLYSAHNLETGNIYFSPSFSDSARRDFITNIENHQGTYFVLNTRTKEWASNLEFSQSFQDFSVNWISNFISGEIDSVNGQTFKKTGDYKLCVSVNPDFLAFEDDFSDSYKIFYNLIRTYNLSQLFLLISPVCLLISLLLTILWAGRSRKTEKLNLYKFDRIFTEPAVFITLAGSFLSFCLAMRLAIQFYILLSLNNYRYPGVIYIGIGLLYLFVYVIFVPGFFSLVRRIKAKTVWKNSAAAWLYHKLSELWIMFSQNKNITIVLLFGIGIFFFIKGAVLLFLALFWYKLYFYVNIGHAIIIYFLVSVVDYLWVIFILAKLFVQLKTIMQDTALIASGDLNHKIKEENLLKPLRPFADNINNIGNGLEKAMQESVKSERMKAELITNVSHDIKTPLTSIINYVGLLKKQNLNDKTAKNYLEVLENKSWRLKTLIEDLVEASKASTGNLNLQLERLNIIELIRQSTGEFEDRFHEKKLEIVLTLPDESIFISADGKSTYRIMENILSNVYKYTLENTRVYLDVTVQMGLITIIVKNISAMKLNITTEELMERFVRGEESRNTEGSGLGLSISRSLASLQNGTFDIILDGDLFKAVLQFPILTE